MISKLAAILRRLWVLAVFGGLVPMTSQAFSWPWEPPPELASNAEFINQRVPYIANGVGVVQVYGPIAMMRAEAKGRMFHLYLRLLSPVDPELLKFETFYLYVAHSAREMCELPTTLKMLLKKQSTQLHYSDKDGSFIATVLVDREFCGFK